MSKTFESEVMHDMIGREIRVGDTIGYPTNMYGEADIELATVTRIDLLQEGVLSNGRAWYRPVDTDAGFNGEDEDGNPILAPYEVAKHGHAVLLVHSADREARVRAWLARSTYIGDTSQKHRLDDPRTKVVLGVDDLVRMLSDLAG